MVSLLRDPVSSPIRSTGSVGRGANRLFGVVRRAGLAVTVTVAGPERPLPVDVDLATPIEILQESLTNALKHGDGTADVNIGYKVEAGWRCGSATRSPVGGSPRTRV